MVHRIQSWFLIKKQKNKEDGKSKKSDLSQVIEKQGREYLPKDPHQLSYQTFKNCSRFAVKIGGRDAGIHYRCARRPILKVHSSEEALTESASVIRYSYKALCEHTVIT